MGRAVPLTALAVIGSNASGRLTHESVTDPFGSAAIAPTGPTSRRARRSAAGGAFVAVKIVVCVKQVPDSWAEKKLNPADNTLDREAADAVVNELDEYAVEEALQIQERLGGADACTVTVLTVGPEKAIESVRKGLQMGADDGVHVVDDALHGSDALATSRSWPRPSTGSRPTSSSWARRAPTPACRSCRRCSPSAPDARS